MIGLIIVCNETAENKPKDICIMQSTCKKKYRLVQAER